MWSQVKVQPQMSLNPYISVQIAGGVPIWEVL